MQPHKLPEDHPNTSWLTTIAPGASKKGTQAAQLSPNAYPCAQHSPYLNRSVITRFLSAVISVGAHLQVR
jgi:hypothetical protein